MLDLLLTLPPANLDSLALFDDLATGNVTVDDLIALQPEIEAAVENLWDLAHRSRRLLERCQQLKPVPSNRVPPGF